MIINLGFYQLDFSPLFAAASNVDNPLESFWFLLKMGGWLPMLLTLLWGFKELWLHYIREKYEQHWKWVVLSIDVPKDNEQSPKAVESIFAQVAGALSSGNLIEKYIKGKVQEPFSFEIASHEGYVRFYVRTTVQFRDLIEAAVYAQYPSAEIMEIDDYTPFAPASFPNEEYNLWGTEFILQNKEAYPIRTYVEFEHTLSQEFKDPMAAFLEALSKLGVGEHIWTQIIIKPVSDHWKEDGILIAKKLIGAKVEEKAGILEKTLGLAHSVFANVVAEIMTAGEEHETKTREAISIMQFLSPGERRVVEAVQMKLGKIGFKTKFRMIYLAKKEIFQKGRGVAPVMGAIKQFNTLDLNGFKTAKSVTTKANYFMVAKRTAARQTKIIKRYKKRSLAGGSPPYILNIEELASLFHFPAMTVKAPLVKKTESKRAEPPISLPIDRGIGASSAPTHSKSAPPHELPTEHNAPSNLPIH